MAHLLGEDVDTGLDLAVVLPELKLGENLESKMRFEQEEQHHDTDLVGE